MTKSERSDAEAAFEEGLERYSRHDLAGSMEAYLHAARLGHPLAQLNLGNILDDEILPSNPAAAVFWYTQSVEGGESSAAWNLAMHYRNKGDGNSYEHWVKRAARMGHPEAIEKLKAEGSGSFKAN